MNYKVLLCLLIAQTTVVHGMLIKGGTRVHRVSPLFFLSRSIHDNSKVYIIPISNPKKFINEDKVSEPSFSEQPMAGKLPLKVREFIDVLRDYKKYEKIGSSVPKGLLLFGPPGVGKTAIVRTIAYEAKGHFLPVNSSEIQGQIVGLGVEKIKKMFDNARKKAAEHGRAIIFFDEIDSIGAARSSYRSVSTDDAMYTLNELLTQMDGFKTTQGVFVVGATNRKDILDPALLRPGRFEFISDVPFPDAEDRDSILRLYLKNMRHAVSNSAIQRAVKGTQGLAADHLKGLVNLSGIKAVRAGNNVVRDEHFLQATDDICQQSGMKEDLSKYIL